MFIIKVEYIKQCLPQYHYHKDNSGILNSTINASENKNGKNN